MNILVQKVTANIESVYPRFWDVPNRFLGDFSDSCAQQQDCFLSQAYRVSGSALYAGVGVENRWRHLKRKEMWYLN